MPSRHIVAATPETEQTPLDQLPGLHAALSHAVLTRLSLGGRSGFGTSLPIRAAVHDLLFNVDHLGHLGIVPGLEAMERVTRLALGDTLPPRECEDRQVHRAVTYLGLQLDRLISLGVWNAAATGEVATVADTVLSRIDVDRVRLDWEMSRKRAVKRIDAIDATVIESDAHHDALMTERRSCVATIDTAYIDFEGELFDAIEARFTGACTPWDWYGFVIAETAWMAAAARGVLGLSEHSRRRIIECPYDCGGQVGLSADPDVADCDGCGKTFPISDGQADAVFTAFRSAGWVAQEVAS